MSQYFIYTRTRDVDYRTVISPSEDFCPMEIRSQFLTEIHGSIDVEAYDDPLDSTRWLYSKKGDLILFGISVMNKSLNSEFNIDCYGRPIRGFFGIVVNCTSNPVLLPFDTNFYRDAYNQLIVPIWNLNKDEYKKSSAIVDYKDATYNMIESRDSNIILNYNDTKCAILGDESPEKVLETALSSRKDTSIIIGFNNKSHAYAVDSQYNFLNAIVNNVCTKEERVISKQNQRNNSESNLISENNKNQINTSERPKKAYPLKLIIGGLIATMIVVLILGKCSKNNHSNQSHSVSGDTILIKNHK